MYCWFICNAWTGELCGQGRWLDGAVRDSEAGFAREAAAVNGLVDVFLDRAWPFISEPGHQNTC